MTRRSPEDGARQVLLTVEYDGTEYHGWQDQPGLPTVEGAIRQAIRGGLGEEAEIRGASRTDRGVHACGQAAGFFTSTPVPAERLPRVLNASLPPDVRIRHARDVTDDFHPRFSAYGKIYRFTFFCSSSESVFFGRFSSRIARCPDLEAMRRASEHLVGEHDFRAFSNASKDPPERTVREIFGIDIVDESPLVHLEVRGSGFLYNMVRTIAGTLLDVGTGRREPASVGEALESRDRRRAGTTAEARGLCLIGVYYSRGNLEAAARERTFLAPWLV